MVKQRDSVVQYPLFPTGGYDFTVEAKPEKFRTPSGKATYRKWRFGTFVNGEKRTFVKVLFPWESKDLLLALGGVEVENDEIEWDDDEVAGKRFTAEIAHEPDYNGKTQAVLKNIAEGLPF